MTRGSSLKNDLRFLINNPKYSDIELICKDEKKLYGCRAILAARSEVFDGLLYNGMKESYEKQISFPTINSSVMEIVLKEAYTGFIEDGTLNEDNIIEVFYAADYFQLMGLRETAIDILTDAKFIKKYSPELLSKVVNTMPLSEDNILLNLLVDSVAIIPLNQIEFGRLSIAALQYLLSCTHEKEQPFATQEYEVFRYSAILAAKQVSNDAYKTLMERIPTLKQIESSTMVENKFIIDHQKVAKELEPLVKFIDFGQIKGQIFADIIDPLEIIPAEIILNVYRQKARSNNTDSNGIRGMSNEYDVWDESACGSSLIITDNGKVVQASSNDCGCQSVRAKTILDNKGIFEWDVIIEKSCTYACVGVCSENFNYEIRAGSQPTGWVLGSSGSCYNSGKCINSRYCPPFKLDGAKITVHLDMNRRTLAFTVNGEKYPEVPAWNNLPSKLYPVVTLHDSGRFRIQSYRKF